MRAGDVRGAWAHTTNLTLGFTLAGMPGQDER
jgi:hypothetical protein